MTKLRSPRPGTIASVLVHVLLLAAILYRAPLHIAPMRLPGTSHGSHIELAYLPSAAPEPASLPNTRTSPKQQALTKSPNPTPTLKPTPSAPASPNVSSPSAANPDAATGSDALGDGNVSIALAQFFPRPKPDLSPLAHGTAGDVILDITIDATGKISGIKVTHSLSPAIDQTVIATVQAWTFHPATRDGQPIPSEQELHFHYERG